MVPAEDIEAARAAGPLKPTYDYEDITTVRDVLDHALSLKRPRHVRVSRADFDLTLRRA